MTYFQRLFKLTTTCVDTADGTVEVYPECLSAKLGEDVHITCTTPSQHDVEWDFKSNGSLSRITICSEGAVSREVIHKYTCKREQTAHTLTINNVSFNDSGTYTCTERDGRGPAVDSASLSVTRK